MIKIDNDCIIYHDDNQNFTVEVKKDNTNQELTIQKITGPGLSGTVSKDHSTDFLNLMYYIRQDLGVQ